MIMEQVISAYCSIRQERVKVNGEIKILDENFITFEELIKSLYKKENIAYPKFYKMDALSKLGFLTAELALKQIDIDLYHKENIGVVLSNAASSLDTDMVYQQSISNRSRYFPSPSVFVYTLPNIVLGEICIKHELKGENAFFVTEKFDPGLMSTYVNELFLHHRVEACLVGWVELLGKEFESLVMFVEPAGKADGKEKKGLTIPFTNRSIEELYNGI